MGRVNGEKKRDTQEESRKKTGGERQDDREQREGGIECSGPACGNSDAVFMDVYLSASPTGSSHFPLGNSWSAGKRFLVGCRRAGGQLSDRDAHIHGIKMPQNPLFPSASVYISRCLI